MQAKREAAHRGLGVRYIFAAVLYVRVAFSEKFMLRIIFRFDVLNGTGMPVPWMYPMRLDQNPIHRREIVPWYDSEIACLILMIWMILSLLFGIVGIAVARQHPAYHQYTWVPVVIVMLSGGVVISAFVRLVKRHIRRLAG